MVPPQKNSRIERSRSGALSATSSICCRNGVAPPETVQPCCSMQATPSAGDHTSISTEVLPAIHGMSKAQIAPVMWVTGEGMKVTSAALMP